MNCFVYLFCIDVGDCVALVFGYYVVYLLRDFVRCSYLMVVYGSGLLVLC